mmetsp:Transcript_32885/g.129139  ORF Transcript_32885/g.129139 Transcript_32885/m.129139 type:complete len:86 (-) Transcript_32885:1100-1357(-)
MKSKAWLVIDLKNKCTPGGGRSRSSFVVGSSEFTNVVKGHDFAEVAEEKGSNDVDYNKLLRSYLSSGFQATNFGLAVNIVEQMVS